MGLQLRLLGELQIARDGRAIELPASKKTRALLGYLVVTRRPQLRSHLCSLLWDGPDDPRAALRWSLAKLRPLVNDAGGERLVADREHVELSLEGAGVDLFDARAALAPGAVDAMTTTELERVSASFRGELLDGLDLPGCYRFHEWCVAEREAARAARIALLEALVGRTRADGANALVFARARVAIDPLSEKAHVAVVELLAGLGRTREALEQVDTCKRILATELSAKPSMALERARMAVGARGTEPAAAMHVPATQASDASEPPHAAGGAEATAEGNLVARERERSLIAAALAEAAHGGPAVLLFIGEPGIGKSRLLAEVVRAARAAGGDALVGRAFEAEMVRPYGPWIEALASAPRGGVPEPVLREAAPLLGVQSASEASGSDKTRLFEAVARLLGALAAAWPPFAVVIDDIHWIDEASAALLHFVARAAVPGLVLAGGARSAELYDNPSALKLLRALGREKRLLEVPVEPLDGGAIEALARSIAPSADGARVHADCQGNPLFAIEIARALARGESSSAQLDRLLDDRLARLDGRSGDVITWAAALGGSFDADTLGRVTGIPPLDLLAALEDLEKRLVIRGRADGAGYDFVHDLVRGAAYRRLSEPRKKLVHLHIARALIATPGDALAGDVAHHAAMGGDLELAVRSCVAAGRRSVRLYALSAAIELVNRGLQLVTFLPLRPRVELTTALYAIAPYAYRGRDATAVEEAMTRFLVEARDHGMNACFEQALHSLSHLRYQRDAWASAAEDSFRLLELSERSDDATSVHALINGGACLALLGREIPKARALLARARAIAEATGTRLAVTQHRMGVAVVHHFAGELDEAVHELRETLATARAEEDHFRSSVSLTHLCMVALERGEWEAAGRWAGELESMADKLGEGSEGPFARAVQAIARRRAGETEPHDRVDAAIAALRAVDAKGLLSYAQTHAAELDLEEGRPANASSRGRDALEAAIAVTRASEAVVARAVLGRAALAHGRRDEALALLRELGPDLEAPGLVSARAHAAASKLAVALELPLALPRRRTRRRS